MFTRGYGLPGNYYDFTWNKMGFVRRHWDSSSKKNVMYAENGFKQEAC
jgi:hypothetical protein